MVADPPSAPAASATTVAVEIALVAPDTGGSMSFERALAARRSQRQFAETALSFRDLGQLAWAAQGITEPTLGLRTAPSAGALYPLDLYFVTPAGVLRYLPAHHAVEQRTRRDLRRELARAAFDQQSVARAACDVVIVATTARTRQKYGDRATRYVTLEAGHVAQNLLLQATALGLGGAPIGAFDDRATGALLGLTAGAEPLYLIAIGRPAAAADPR